MPPSIDNTTDRPQVSPEQMQEFYAQRIFDAAIGRLTAQQRQLEPGSESDLMLHCRSIATGMPQTLDEAYVLQLQSQLALANMAADEGDALGRNVADENDPASSGSMTPSARQLASAAARLQMQDEATQSLGLVADLQVDLVRTRERMSDALSVARSRSHHSLVLLDNVNAPNSDRNSDVVSLDPNDLAQMDDVVVGPIELELDLNDVEPEQRQHRSAPMLRTARTTQQQQQQQQQQGEEEGEERTIEEEATLLASIASLQFDLLQTRQKLIDERSFSHSRHLEDIAIPTLEEATPEASQEFTVESVVSDQQLQEEEQPTTEAAAVSTSTATQSTPQEGEVNDATARLASLLVIADAAPKTSGDSSVLGPRIRSGDPVQRRFSNQMA